MELPTSCYLSVSLSVRQTVHPRACVPARRRQVIHRDLKLDNIMLCGPPGAKATELEAKLVDFGLHAVVDAARDPKAQEIQRRLCVLGFRVQG
jgi:serine/threonine protein kinase